MFLYFNGDGVRDGKSGEVENSGGGRKETGRIG